MNKSSITVKALTRPTLLALLVASALSGCSLVPTYERPELAVPATLPDAATGGASAPAGNVAQVPWTQYFPDARLQSLIRRALDNNRDLRVAVLNIEQLRAAYQIQNADRFPTLNGVVNGSRGPSSASPYPLTTTVTGGVSLASFELDLFGRVKALSDVASAQVLASEESRKSVHISLVASVANGYYALWADRWQLALAEQTLTTRQDSLRLLQLKFDNGVLNELDLRSAQSLVEAAKVTRAQAQRQWAQDLSALSVLLGQSVPADLLPPVPQLDAQSLGRSANSQSAAQVVQGTLWPALSELPTGLSSEVLLQRPDIAQAEQQLIAANANIGAARAARFPRISLTASAGVVSDSLSGLFDDGRNAWNFAPSLAVPLFDMGRTAAGVDSAKVKRDMAVAQYDKAVQTAFKEVADALVARRTYAEQADAQLAQAQAEAARLRLATLRYDTGVANQLDLLDAQRSLFTAQQALIAAQLARQQAHISVYKALGGGWLDRAAQETASASR
ncbi:MAG: efflux transporter outer membrane subunit [Aquabacterium sp.]|uniref:efflux transporter outer membrane subunit n=1 Tax=Aquabacterium sp. TaxID=1872578 RepID=UPI003BC19598